MAMIRDINAIYMQGFDDDDLIEEELHQLKLMGIPDVPVPPEKPTLDVELKQHDSTISLLFNMTKTTGIALADTVSTITFMDL
jgi:hypothetical protein